MILINTTKQNVWLWQPLLAAELYTVEYHPVECKADIEVQGGCCKCIIPACGTRHHHGSSGTGRVNIHRYINSQP